MTGSKSYRFSYIFWGLALCLFWPSLSFSKMNNEYPDIIYLSQDLLYAAKTGEDTDSMENLLKNIPQGEVIKQLHSDNQKLSFYLNLYNAFVQLVLDKKPELYNNRNKFYKSKLFAFAGKFWSLDEIEHDLLRKSSVKLSLGYLNKIAVSDLKIKLRVINIDPRIHFALNCGAKSCPPIAFYEPDKINEQLDIAVKSYLSQDTEYDSIKNTVKINRLFSWFRGDFGGKKGIYKFLYKYDLIPQGTKPKLIFLPYDWTLERKKFIN